MPLKGAKPCGAKTRSGKKCRNPAMQNGKCRMHGGSTPSGIASPHTVHGGRSRVLPPGMVDKYHEALNDPDLLNLRLEIALTDARIGDLISRLDQRDPGKRWVEFQKQYEAFSASIIAGNTESGTEALKAMGDLIKSGVTDEYHWETITDLVNERRKLVDTERKRLVAMQQTLTYEQALLLVGALSGILREEVTDTHVLSRIQTRLTGLLNQRAGGAHLTG